MSSKTATKKVVVETKPVETKHVETKHAKADAKHDSKPEVKKEVKHEVKSEASVPEKKSRKSKSEPTDSAVVSQLAASVVEASTDEAKVRRVVNNEEIEKSFDELSKSLDDELQALRDDKTHAIGIRYLRSLARQVKSLKTDCFRLLSRKTRKPSQRSGNSGFMKAVKITSAMSKFCGFKEEQLVSRVDVTKSICNYVKNNNLQNPADRRQFTPDDKLAKLLATTETITYYTLQKHIQQHFVKADK